MTISNAYADPRLDQTYTFVNLNIFRELEEVYGQAQIRLRSKDRLLEGALLGQALRVLVKGEGSLPIYFDQRSRRTKRDRRSSRRSEGLMIIGDSLSANSHFISCLLHPRAAGLKQEWREIVHQWASRRELSVFERDSFAAQHGATTWELLRPSILNVKGGYGMRRRPKLISEPDPLSPFERELSYNRARFASVLLGSNDLHYHKGFQRFVWRYIQIIESLLDAGVTPILQTLPPQKTDKRTLSKLTRFNQAIRAIASVERVPLLDIHQIMKTLNRDGLREDGLHLNAYAGGCRLNKNGLRYGQNLRNYKFLELYTLLKAREQSLFETRRGERPALSTELSPTLVTAVTGDSPTISDETPCVRQMLKRSKRARRWVHLRRLSIHRGTEMGPPVNGYGEWRFDRQYLKGSMQRSSSVLALLNPGKKGDLSSAQLWIRDKQGKCKSVTNDPHSLGTHTKGLELLHFYRPHLSKLSPKNEDSSRGSVAIFTW